MTNQELKYELENKLMEVFPLTKKETYQDISTEDIIESLNEMKFDIQSKTGRQVLEDLPMSIPRDTAIDMSVQLYIHIGKRLVTEIKKL
jgi:hypothetical protein